MVQTNNEMDTQDSGLAAQEGAAVVNGGATAGIVDTATVTATSTTTPPQQQELNNAHMMKTSVLQERVRNLRDKMALGRQSLQQQAEQSPAERKKNDDLAAQTMKAFQNAVGADDSNSPTTSTTLPVKEKYQSSPVNQNEPVALKKARTRKSRRELQDQIDGLQEVLVKLAGNNPQLQAKVRQLVVRHPSLRELELFTALNKRQQGGAQPTSVNLGGKQTVGAAGTKQRYNSEPVSGKVRHESELSSTSSCVSQREQQEAGAANIWEGGTKKKRKRQANKSKSATKTQASEQKALANYINNIVADYLGEQQKEPTAELQFQGGVEDLEAYAQRLVQAGIGRIVEDEIRINRKNNRQAFVAVNSDRECLERDGIILLPVARRYAFEGDTVRAFVMNRGGAASVASSSAGAGAASVAEKTEPASTSTIRGGKDTSFSLADDEEDPFATEDSDLEATELDATMPAVPDNCPKAFVIAIVQQTELRQVVGTISFKNPSKLNDERLFYKLKPHDMRVPMVYVAEDTCAEHATDEAKKEVCGFLYVARVLETDIDGNCIAELVQPVGKVGNLEAEIKAILLHNKLKDFRPYEQRFNDMYAQPEAPYDAAQHPQREDLRSKCIFTIDPLTARDLDDAMSIERISAHEVEVGVHISDVAHYLAEDCELDNIVKERATSIYLVNEVIHMLPQPLCFKCSLLPGEEKLAFSVFWRMTEEGELLAPPRFTRSVIQSCSQFAYEHAQKIIDNPEEQFDSDDDFPTICNGFTPTDIVERVRLLHDIAQHLRKKRYENGALSINNPKLRFTLDTTTGEPTSYTVDGRQEANFLIEEFMLLANQSVAKFIHDHFPDISILRNHAPPLSKSMKALREKLSNLGIEFDFSSSKAVYESMQRICRESSDPAAMDACLNTLLTKPMARAQYFCSDGKTDEAALWHYALSIPIYTHFTSPIRRYPDILVHRLLGAALGYCAPPKRTVDELHHLAKVCNDQKYNAKNAGDESSLLFFKRYVEIQQSLKLRAVVTEIFQHLVNVTTIETGHAISISYKMQKVLVNTANAPAFIFISEKNSKIAPIKLQMFSTVDVKLAVWNNKLCGFFASPDPEQRKLYYKTKNQNKPHGKMVENGINNGVIRKVRQNSQSNGLNSPDKTASGNNNQLQHQSKGKGTPKSQRVYALTADST